MGLLYLLQSLQPTEIIRNKRHIIVRSFTASCFSLALFQFQSSPLSFILLLYLVFRIFHYPLTFLLFFLHVLLTSFHSLATGWTVQGSNSLGGHDFPQPSRTALGPIQPPEQWLPDLCQG